jgi:hypothetical protein
VVGDSLSFIVGKRSKEERTTEMRVILDVTGKELALLYIATGNADAGRIIKESCRDEQAFLLKQKALATAKKEGLI